MKTNLSFNKAFLEKPTWLSGKSLFITLFMFALCIHSVSAQRQMEKLERGLTAVKVSNGVFLSWRILGDEWSKNVSYNVYRNNTRITTISSTGASNYTDAGGTNSSTYYIRVVINNVEQPASIATPVWADFYKTIPVKQVAGDPNWEYQINDIAVGDLDGDGFYEFVVKRLPPDSEFDGGFLSNRTSRLEAYEWDGNKKWEVDLGVNVNYPVEDHPIVYDLDGDGKAEIAIRTSEGTKFGDGFTIGDVNGDGRTNYRPASPGYINVGPQFLSIISGVNGKELARTNYISRDPVTDYGDDWGHRANKYLSAVAYLDGVRPSIVMCRGYYPAREGKGRTVIQALDYRNGTLTNRWTFNAQAGGENSAYVGQGNHNLSVGDVDGDGFDEIIYGAMAVDHNGRGKYSTGLGHGDAINFTDLDPDRPGLEVFQPHEYASGASYRDANTGQILAQVLKSTSGDVPRGCAADIDGIRGAEFWCNGGNLFALNGSVKGAAPPYATWLVWWDGDESREMSNGTVLDKYVNGGISRRVTFYNYGVDKINGTKNTPCLGGDILGDWREEMVFRSFDNRNIVIFTTTNPTNRRLYTLMHDPIYRLAIAWQPVTYNQPPHPGFYLGAGMSAPPTPNIYYPGTPPTSDVLPNGTYTIAARHSGQVLDVAANSTADGANVDQYPSQNSNNQKWNVTSVGNGFYTIKAVHSGKSLDVNARSTADGANITQWTASSTATNQQFSIVDQGGGYYQIIARHSNKCVEVANASTANGANVQQWTCSASATHQQFRFTPVSAARIAGENLEEADLLAYPNPSGNAFQVKISGEFTYTITDQVGIVKEKGTGKEGILVGSKLKPGIYILQVQTSTGTKEVKLIKN